MPRSILAVNPDTGVLKWYFQNVPGDEWDYDSAQQLLLADITVARTAPQGSHAGQ